MKKICLTFLLGTVAFLTGCGQNAYNGFKDPNVDMTVREISAKNEEDILNMLSDARSCVVGISVDLKNGYAVGSGVAISDGGYILTNNHVVSDGNEITLYFADKTKLGAEVVWADPSIDMAVVKTSRQIPYLSTEDLKNVFVGEDIYAIGTPLTLEFKHTVTKGIVSSTKRTLESEGEKGTIFLQNLIQHDASINPGNSGGPLITASGKVIGLNTLKASEGEGIAFAIPIKLGKIVVNKLKQNKSYVTPYMGVFALDADLAEVYGRNLKDGVYVVSVTGPAKKAGIKEGDVIKSINNEEINNMLDFRSAIYEKDVGDIVEVIIERNNQQITKLIKLEKK